MSSTSCLNPSENNFSSKETLTEMSKWPKSKHKNSWSIWSEDNSKRIHHLKEISNHWPITSVMKADALFQQTLTAIIVTHWDSMPVRLSKLDKLEWWAAWEIWKNNLRSGFQADIHWLQWWMLSFVRMNMCQSSRKHLSNWTDLSSSFMRNLETLGPWANILTWLAQCNMSSQMSVHIWQLSPRSSNFLHNFSRNTQKPKSHLQE